MATAGPSPTAAESDLESPTATPAPSGSPAATSPTAIDLARAEVDRLVRLVEAIHPEPFHDTDRGVFIAAAEALKDDLPTLTEDQALVALLRLYGMITTTRGEGHSHALTFPLQDGDRPMLPLHLWLFGDEVTIVDALAPHEDLVGSRITAVGGHPIADVVAALDPIVPRDHPGTVPLFLPRYLVVPAVLEGLGFTESSEAVELTVTPATGGSRESRVTVEAVPSADIVDWKGALGLFRLPEGPDSGWLARIEESSWWDERDGALVIQLNLMFESMDAVVAEVRARLDRGGVDRIILDVRHDLGGNYGQGAFMSDLLIEQATERPGSTFVLTSRSTFSAGALLVRDIDAGSDVVLAGETPGGALEFWADHRTVALDDYPGRPVVNIPTRHWQPRDPSDDRIAVEPDLALDARWTDIARGRDRVLEAVLQH